MHPVSEVRPQAVAGMFYPRDPAELRGDIRELLAGVPAAAGHRWPKAVVVPHAGYVYSASTAAHAYALLAPGRGTIGRVVLLGPVHRVPVRGLALPGAAAFQTPLGLVAVDQQAIDAIAGMPQVVTSARVHQHEHALEVQLPFIQEVLGDVRVLPLAVGDATLEEVAEVLEALWGGPETIIVVSSDLSHYHPYDTARRIDTETVQKMLRGECDIGHRQACGATPVNGLLLSAPRHGLHPRLLALCNSGDTAGDRSRVVGYASLAFEEAAPDEGELPAEAGEQLVAIAAAAIARAVGASADTDADTSAAWLQQPGATFVTLKRHGRLRGCIGSLQATRPLLQDLEHNAVAAALHDPRFPPLARTDLQDLRVEVSLLSEPQPMQVADEADALAQLQPGVDGVILAWRGRRSTFLPQVWDELREPQDFLAQLKRKAGLPVDFWAPDITLQRYTVAKWGSDLDVP
jgi:AmmeMemoRadiSam system protein B/AmmeMemoRadiSam system protein A